MQLKAFDVKTFINIITQAASCICLASVRLSVGLSNLFLTLIERAAYTRRDLLRAARNAASIHFRPSIRRTDILVCFAVVDASLSRLFRVKRALKDSDFKIIYMPPQRSDVVQRAEKRDEYEKFDCKCG